MELAG